MSLNIVEREIEFALRGFYGYARRLRRIYRQEHADRQEQHRRLFPGPHFRVMDIGEGRNFIAPRDALPCSRARRSSRPRKNADPPLIL